MTTQTAQTFTAPSNWLYEVLKLLDALARDGITLEGYADPADLMYEFAEHLKLGQDEDPWLAALIAVKGMPND